MLLLFFESGFLEIHVCFPRDILQIFDRWTTFVGPIDPEIWLSQGLFFFSWLGLLGYYRRKNGPVNQLSLASVCENCVLRSDDHNRPFLFHRQFVQYQCQSMPAAIWNKSLNCWNLYLHITLLSWHTSLLGMPLIAVNFLCLYVHNIFQPQMCLYLNSNIKGFFIIRINHWCCHSYRRRVSEIFLSLVSGWEYGLEATVL